MTVDSNQNVTWGSAPQNIANIDGYKVACTGSCGRKNAGEISLPNGLPNYSSSKQELS
jgi:hypothetical protein